MLVKHSNYAGVCKVAFCYKHRGMFRFGIALAVILGGSGDLCVHFLVFLLPE